MWHELREHVLSGVRAYSGNDDPDCIDRITGNWFQDQENSISAYPAFYHERLIATWGEALSFPDSHLSQSRMLPAIVRKAKSLGRLFLEEKRLNLRVKKIR